MTLLFKNIQKKERKPTYVTIIEKGLNEVLKWILKGENPNKFERNKDPLSRAGNYLKKSDPKTK